MVEQHIYTRAIKSLYSNSAGYGSVAKSRGLNDEFVVEVLEPLCRVAGAYFINFPDEYECMVIGNSLNKTDFTGDRQTGFFHNYVFDADGIEQIMRFDYPGIIGGFLTGYGEEYGGVLPELELSSGFITENLVINNVDFRAYGNELTLMLVYAFATCKKNAKKLYLGVCLEDVSGFSKALFSYIISLLPFPYRTVLGFLSFSPEPQPYKGFDVIGVYGHGLNIEDFEDDYIFVINPKDCSFVSNISKVESGYSPEQVDQITELLKFLLFTGGGATGYLDYAADVLRTSHRDVKSDIMIYAEIYNLYRIKDSEHGSNEEKLKLNESLDNSAAEMAELIYYLFRMREKTGYEFFAEDLLYGLNLDIYNACEAVMCGEAELTSFGSISDKLKEVLVNLVEYLAKIQGSLNYQMIKVCFTAKGVPDCVKLYEMVKDIATRLMNETKVENAFDTCVQCLKWIVQNHSKDASSKSFQDAVDMFANDFSKELSDKDTKNRIAEEFKGVPSFDRHFAPVGKEGLFKRLFNRGRFK